MWVDGKTLETQNVQVAQKPDKSESKEAKTSLKIFPFTRELEERLDINQFKNLNRQISQIENKYWVWATEIVKNCLNVFKDNKELLTVWELFDFLQEQWILELLSQIPEPWKQAEVVWTFFEQFKESKQKDEKIVELEWQKAALSGNNVLNVWKNWFKESEKIKEYLVLSENLYLSSKVIKEKVLSHISEEEFNKTKEQSKQQVLDAAKKKWVELSNEQLEQISYVQTVKSLLPKDIPDEHQWLVNSFLGDYDKLNSWLGLNSNSLLAQASNNEKNTKNESIKSFLEWDNRTEKFDWDYEKLLVSKFIKKEWDNSELTDEEKTKLEEIKSNINGMKSIFANRVALNSFEWSLFGILWWFNIEWNSNSSRDYNINKETWEFNAVSMIWSLPMDIKVTWDGKLYITDYLANNWKSYNIGQKLVNTSFDLPTLNSYKFLIEWVDIKAIVQSSTSFEDLQLKYEQSLKTQFDKITTDVQKTFLQSESNYELSRLINTNKLISFYRPPEEIAWYNWNNKENARIDMINKPWIYSYFDLIKNTADVYDSSSLLKITQLFEDFTRFASNPSNLDNHPQKWIIQKYSWNPPDIMWFIVSAWIVDKKSDTKFINLDKLEKFQSSIIKKESSNINNDFDDLFFDN